jgi:predicted flap endonuclease-1-like 5' DNA nuclease
MAEKTEGMTCETRAWVIAAAAGVLAFLLLILLWGWGFLWSAVVGVVLAVVLGFLITRLYCADGGETEEMWTPGARAGEGDAAARSTTPGAASVQPQPTAVVPPAATNESQDASADDRTASVPLTATPEADAKAAAPAEPAPQPEAEPEEAAPSRADGEGKPELLDAPRGAPDDLKRIKGVGPKLEEKLNGLGIFHYSQIAAWGADEIAWVDDQLNFRGRIDRDGWIEQAKTLAAGGETEFSRRADGKETG